MSSRTKDTFLSILPQLGKLAPAIAAAIGGPIPAVASAAVQALANHLGRPGAQPEEVVEAFAAMTPDERLEMARIDNEFRLAMARTGVDVFKLELEDVQSARSMATSSDTSAHVWLSAAFIIGLFFTVYFLLANSERDLDEFAKATITYFIGVLSTEVARIMRFWFGSNDPQRARGREE
jgi:hypothetical protein